MREFESSLEDFCKFAEAYAEKTKMSNEELCHLLQACCERLVMKHQWAISSAVFEARTNKRAD